MIKIAVTGSSGFVGKHLVKTLKKQYEKIIELDIDKGYDLSDNENIKRIPFFDIIIHLAAKSFVPLSFEKPYDFYFYNYLLTLNVLELASKFKAKVVFISSYLYGEPEYIPIDEKHPLKPHNPYAQSKLICEKLCEGYNRDFDVPVTVLRPFNIYGPGQNENFLIPSIIKEIKRGKIVLNDPRPKRDFIYIDDFIRAIELIISSDLNGLKTFNIGSGVSLSIYEIVTLIKTAMHSEAEVDYTHTYRQSEVMETSADISKISDFFHWNPEITFLSGIINIIKSLNN